MTDINTNTDIKKAAEIIRGGGIVAFPTETVYGLGANALDEKAVAKVFEAKKRPFFDPLILHIGERDQISTVVDDAHIPAQAHRLMDKFWPGPLTVILPKKPTVPDITTSGLPGAGVRLPSNDTARKLINAAGTPIAAPSANLFGYVSPTTAEHVRAQLGQDVDMIIDGGECTVGIESTIISFMDNRPIMLRPGGIALEDIEEAIGKVVVPANDDLVNQSPGRCEQHYATSTPLVLVNNARDIRDNSDSKDTGRKVGLIALEPGDSLALPDNVVKIEYLSQNGDLREAACNLFAAMRRLDASGVDIIAALPIPDTGLGRAINDRLRRASKKGVAA